MTIDYTVDESLDPIRATHAAAKYLAEQLPLRSKTGRWPSPPTIMAWPAW